MTQPRWLQAVGALLLGGLGCYSLTDWWANRSTGLPASTVPERSRDAALSDPWVQPLGAVAFLVIAGCLCLQLLPPPSRSTLAAPGGVSVRLRRATALWVPLLVGASLGGWLGFLAVALTQQGLVIHALVSGAAAVPMALVVPLHLPAVLRPRARLLLTADGLHYRGWSAESTLAWADVDRVEQAWAPRHRDQVLAIFPTPGAPSFRVHRRRSWWPARFRIDHPHDDRIEVPIVALSHPTALRETIAAIGADPGNRCRLEHPQVLDHLNGRGPSPWALVPPGPRRL
ncbi:hypothetical protein BH11ACT8_BH11ACT8_20300 [soil metagenome]